VKRDVVHADQKASIPFSS